MKVFLFYLFIDWLCCVFVVYTGFLSLWWEQELLFLVVHDLLIAVTSLDPRAS